MNGTSPPAIRRGKRWSARRRNDLFAAVGVTVLVTLGWCLTYRIFEDQRIDDPVSYHADAHITAAIVAASARGDFVPFRSKLIPSLGAPFVANWNDFPLSEDWLFFLVGQLARVLGTFGAINVGFWFSCVLGALALFYVARALHQSREFAFLIAVLFGLAPHVFFRGVHHYSLTHDWFLPCAVLVAIWVGSRKAIPFRSGKFQFAALTMVIAGWSNVYYLFFTLQLVGLALLSHVGRGWRKSRILPSLTLIAIAAAAFVSVSWDTISFARENGRNEQAVQRNPNEGEVYALKPINLLVPDTRHRFEFMRTIAQHRNEASVIPGEVGSQYLGFIGIAFLFWLLLHAATSVGRGRMDFGVASALVVAWFIIGHSVGGENGVLAVAGFNLFRSVNRASIVIFAVVLLYGGWALSRSKLLGRVPKFVRWVGAVTLAWLGGWEAMPVVSSEASVASDRARADADRFLVAKAEAVLPAGARVFQLPAMNFPETPPVGGVDSYELFRPYFFSRSLVFSHGDIKGRPNADWKFRVAQLRPAEMIAELKANGFAAIYINVKAYGSVDGVSAAFVAAGASVIAVAPTGDSVMLAL